MAAGTSPTRAAAVKKSLSQPPFMVSRSSCQGPVRLGGDVRISIEAEIAVAGKMHHGSLGEGGDGQERIDADRARDHRAVADIKSAMHALFALPVEHLAFVIDHAACPILPHAAAAKRMSGRGL